MSTEDSETVEDGLRIVRRRSANILSPVAALLPKNVVSAMWRPALRDWLAQERPAIVHLHNPHPPGGLAEAAADCLALGIPYVVSTHGFVEFNDPTRFLGQSRWHRSVYERLVRQPVAEVARNAARVLALSPEEEPVLLAMGVRSDRIAVVTNGVDRYYAEVLASADRLRQIQRFKLPDGKPILLFVGNQTLNKGIDVLLRALPLLREDAVAVIAGAIRSPGELSALRDVAKFGSDDPRLVFTDFVTREELRALYQTADIFTFPSLADTLPLVILEAMVSGMPVVATRVGGIPFEVTPDTGSLVNPGDHHGLAREIDRLCASPSLREAMGRAGRQRALELFDWGASAEKAITIYQSVLNEASWRSSRGP
jgi:glycosyltransferase involved in cell wall biosynthesis